MLDKLPPEVILTISKHLTLKDKLAVITTCRHLHTLIAKTSLFTELDLLDTKEQEDIIKKYRDNQPAGTQTKQLWIDINRLSDELFFQLSTVFPNVARITTRKNTTTNGCTIRLQDRYAKGPMLKWKDTLTTYNLRYDWPDIVHTLKTTTFSRLTELRLGHYFDFGDKKNGFDIPYFIQHIQHAPSLRKLELSRCALDLAFLEQIHASSPYLQWLALKEAVMMIKMDVLPQSITPADSVLSLVISSTHVFDRNGLFLDYITTKYRHLKELEFGLVEGYTASDFAKYYNKDVSGEISNTEEKQEYTDIFESLQDDIDVTSGVYRVSGSKFFSHLPASIKSLSLPYTLFDNPIEMLAKSDIRPAVLNCLFLNNDGSILREIQQFQYINTLTSLRTLGLRLELPQQPLDNISPLTSVTKLIISARGPLYVDWLLASFPSIEKLYLLGDNRLITNAYDEIDERYPHLQSLTIKSGELTQEAFDYIKTAAPNIHSLDLSVTVDPLPLSFDISAWDMTRLNIALKNKTEKEQHLYYIITGNTHKMIRYDPSECTITLVKDPYYIREPIVHLVCKSQLNFILHGYAVYLMLDKIVILY